MSSKSKYKLLLFIVSLIGPSIAIRAQNNDSLLLQNALKKKNNYHYAEAINYLNEYLKLHPKDSIAFFEKINCKENLSLFQEVIDDCDLWLKDKPKSEYIMISKADALVRLNELFEALKIYNQTIKYFPASAIAFKDRGDVKEKLGEYLVAIDDYSVAIHLDNDFYDAYFGRGVANANLKNFQSAISDYNISLKYFTSDPIIYYKLAEAKMHLYNFEDAIKNCNKIIALDMLFKKEGYVLKAIAYENLKQYNLAIENYTNSINEFPDFDIAYFKRGLLKIKMNFIKDGLEDIKIAKKINPNLSQDKDYYREFYSVYSMPEDSTKEVNSISVENYSDLFLKRCLEQFKKTEELQAVDIDGEKYCFCALEKLKQNKVTGQQWDQFKDENSVLYNEVIALCWNDALNPRQKSNDIVSPLADQRIPLVLMGGVFKIKVRIGNIDKYYLLDTGASDLVIDEDTEKSLLLLGILSEKSYLKEKFYSLANGDNVKLRRVILNNVIIGDFIVNNVIAAIASSGGFLLGKSFLDKFSRWTIDSDNSNLFLEK